jgi:hypothetical protein
MKDNEIGLIPIPCPHDGGAGVALTSMIYDVRRSRGRSSAAARKVAQEPRDIAANLIDPSAALDPAVDTTAAPKTRSCRAREKRSRIDPVRQRDVPDRECGEIRLQRARDAEKRSEVLARFRPQP